MSRASVRTSRSMSRGIRERLSALSRLSGRSTSGTSGPSFKERVINIMAAQMKISHDEAAKKFDDAQAKLQQTR